MADIIVGTCSICGGPVVTPDMILSTAQPTTFCKRCGATAVESYGPVIPMRPSYKQYGGARSSI